MFPCPICRYERSEIEAACIECGWSPSQTRTTKSCPDSKSKPFDGCGQFLLGAVISFHGLGWSLMMMFMWQKDKPSPLSFGPALWDLAHKSRWAHFVPLFSGLILLFAGFINFFGSRKFNAIPMFVALGMIIAYICWLSMSI